MVWGLYKRQAYRHILTPAAKTHTNVARRSQCKEKGLPRMRKALKEKRADDPSTMRDVAIHVGRVTA